MHLHELLDWPGPMTHRQFMLWQRWVDAEWNKPDRRDHYAMQVAQRVRQQWSKKPNKVKLEDQKIPFNKGTRQQGDLHGAEAVAESKSMWAAAVGGDVREVGP